jgi:hypothetical protein
VKRYEFVKALLSEGQGKDIKEGGHQIEYDDEDAEIHRLFESELRLSGVSCGMRSKVKWCSGSIGTDSGHMVSHQVHAS